MHRFARFFRVFQAFSEESLGKFWEEVDDEGEALVVLIANERLRYVD